MWDIFKKFTAKPTVKTDAVSNTEATAMGENQVKIENPRNIYGLYTQEFSGMTPNNLYLYLESARKGVNWYKSLFFEEIKRRDSEIGGDCQTRKYSVVKEEHEISFKKNSKVGQSLQNEILYMFEDMFDNLNLENFITDSVEAQIQGVSTFENMWKVKNGKFIISAIDYINNHLLCFDDINNKYRYLKTEDSDGMKMRLKGLDPMADRIDVSGMVIDELNPFKITEVHSLDGNAQNGFMNGCIDSLIWAFIFKNYGLKDWSIYIERFGTPSLVVKYPPLMGRDDKRMLREAVEKYGKLFKVMIPNTAEWDVVTDNQKGSSNSGFDSYVGYWDKKIALRLLGQTLTSGSGDKGGSYALGKVHNMVREDLQMADMLLVKDTMNKLIRKVMALNYANLPDFPIFSFRQEKDIEYKVKRSEIVKNLSVSGYRVSQEDIEEEFDVTVHEIAPNNAPPNQQYVEQFIKEYFYGVH